MKTLTLTLALTCPLIAQAQRAPDAIPLEIAYTALHIADWNQTRHIAQAPTAFQEKNLLLGDHPTGPQVNRYFAGTLLAHWAIAMALPDNYRRAFQGISIAVEANTVRRNYAIGLSARF